MLLAEVSSAELTAWQAFLIWRAEEARRRKREQAHFDDDDDEVTYW